MERYTELLYWVKFRQYIHFDEKTGKVTYDPELPERARISYEMWRSQ